MTLMVPLTALLVTTNVVTLVIVVWLKWREKKWHRMREHGKAPILTVEYGESAKSEDLDQVDWKMKFHADVPPFVVRMSLQQADNFSRSIAQEVDHKRWINEKVTKK